MAPPSHALEPPTNPGAIHSDISTSLAENVEEFDLAPVASAANAAVSATSGSQLLGGNKFANVLVAPHGNVVMYGGQDNHIYNVDQNNNFDKIVENANE